MNNSTRVWLIRHGEPTARARNRCYGKSDFGLSDSGRFQIGQVTQYLENEQIAAFYSSPRTRAVESATILAKERSCHVLEDLAEIDFGDFEGLLYDEIAERYPDLYQQWMQTPTEVHFPNGECFQQMRARVLNIFQKLLAQHAGQTFALISHGGVNRILIAWALQMPDDCLFRLAQPYAAVNLLEFMEDVPSVQILNGLRLETVA